MLKMAQKAVALITLMALFIVGLSINSDVLASSYVNASKGDQVKVLTKTPGYKYPGLKGLKGYAYKGEVLQVLDQPKSTVLYVKNKYGVKGYITAETNNVKLIQQNTSPEADKPSNPSRAVLEQKFLAAAKKYLGVPYKLGGDYDRDGSYTFDSSGYVKRVYQDTGIYFPPRTTTTQWKFTRANQISYQDIQVGDLVFFDLNDNGYVDHNSVYVGNGLVIGASTANGGKVQYHNLNKSAWWRSKIIYVTKVF